MRRARPAALDHLSSGESEQGSEDSAPPSPPESASVLLQRLPEGLPARGSRAPPARRDAILQRRRQRREWLGRRERAGDVW
eukprot:COSAG04_NODE_727_length_10782_cov_6.282599_1_plen_80_part_10